MTVPAGQPPGDVWGFSALSKTSSHRPRSRSSPKTAARTASTPVPACTQPSTAPRAAN